MTKKTTKRFPLWAKILIAMFVGILYGLIAAISGWGEFTNNWIKPWGTIFINLLKMIAVPLIIVSLISGISKLKDISKLSRIGIKTISLYLLSTTIAVSLGLSLVNLTNPGAVFPQEKKAEMQQKYASSVLEKQESAKEIKSSSPLQFMVDMVPSNIVKASTDNSKMLQLIFFAILFGIAMVMLPEETIRPVKDFFDALDKVILKLIDLIMEVAPLGVFALLGNLIVEVAGDDPASSLDLFKALGIYALTVVFGLLLMIFVIYPLLIKFGSKMPYGRFIRGIAPAQLLAFSTSSSAATLPVTMEQCEKDLGISEEITSFVLPIGATVNMDGTSLYQAVAAVFIAQVLGFDLTLAQQLTIVLTATLASIGSAAVPSAGIVMLVIVLTAIGVPTEGIALIFAIDRPLDMLRTTVNITGDSAIATIVGHSENKIDYTVRPNHE